MELALRRCLLAHRPRVDAAPYPAREVRGGRSSCRDWVANPAAYETGDVPTTAPENAVPKLARRMAWQVLLQHDGPSPQLSVRCVSHAPELPEAAEWLWSTWQETTATW